MQEYDSAPGRAPLTSGYWRHEPEWPLARGQERTFHLAGGGVLSDVAPATTSDRATIAYHPGVGTTFGLFGGSSAWIQPADQRLRTPGPYLDISPLQAPLEIIGNGSVGLRASVTTDVADARVRLVDVAPDGAAALVTKGVPIHPPRLHEQPSPVKAGRSYDVQIPLEGDVVGLRPRPRRPNRGHRGRLPAAVAVAQPCMT